MFGRWLSALGTTEWMIVFQLYVHGWDFLLLYMQEFLPSSSTFHILCFHHSYKCNSSMKWYQYYPSLDLADFHVVEPSILFVYRLLLLSVQSTCPEVLSSIVWTRVFIYCPMYGRVCLGLVCWRQTFPRPFIWTSKLSLIDFISLRPENFLVLGFLTLYDWFK